MRVSSYLPLPKELKVKRGCLNTQNNNRKCFLWSILASLHPVQHRNHPDRVTKYQEYESELNMSGVKYPVDIKEIDKFEHQNNITVNVYGCENKKIFPLRITTTGIGRHCMNLSYITAGETSHYVLLKDLNRLISRQNNNHNDKKYFWKTIWKDANYTGQKESSSHNLTTRRSATKSSLQEQNTNYIYFLSSVRISKVCYVNKTRVGHRHQNPLSPIPASRTMWELHLHKMQWWARLWTIPSKYRGWRHWKVFGSGLSCRNHL